MRRTWRCLVGWLLVGLMVLQLPMTALADEIVPIEVEEAAEPSLSEAETGQMDEEDPVMDSDLPVDSAEDSAVPSEEKLSSDTDLIEGIEVLSDAEAAALDAQADESGTEDAEATEIEVTVSVSKFGEFLKDKDGELMTGRTVTLTGQASYTMDDALKAAHDQYYPGGAEAGYDYHADEEGFYDGVIYRLWGIDRKVGSRIGYALNHDTSVMWANPALSEKVQDGDDLQFFVQQKNELLAFFAQTEQTVREDQNAVLRLRTANGNQYKDCAGASIYIDGELQEGLITDENGRVTLPALPYREAPYFITAKKTTLVGGEERTAITAAYSRLTVIQAGEASGNYVKSVTLRNVLDWYEKKQTEMTLETLDGSEAFLVPSEYVHMPLDSQTNAYMYVSAELSDDLPEDAKAYVVYEDPSDETMHRVTLQKKGFTYLIGAIHKGNRNQAIQSLQIEVRRNGQLVETHTLPVTYKNHLRFLSVQDSWGHELLPGLADTTYDQSWTIEVPENATSVTIQSTPYGYSNNYGACTTKELAINGEAIPLAFYQSYQFVPDWQTHEEYIIEMRIIDEATLHCLDSASYTITLKKGGWDYTPDVQLTSTRGIGMLAQGSEPPVLTANVSVTGPNGEVEDTSSCSYQWGYYTKNRKIYTEIEGATEVSYIVPTDTRTIARGYCCRVTYEKEGHVYSGESGIKNFFINPEKVETPVIEKQPQNVQHVLGKQEIIQLEIALEKTEWEYDTFSDFKARYQWYQSAEADVTKGRLLAGATEATYNPIVTKAGTVYYYCKVKYERNDYNADTGNVYSYSDEVCSDIAKVECITESFPWEGNGSESNPYQLKTAEDLEALREKVNTDGYSFDGMHFQMMADITLPSNWKPIGGLATGHGLSENGKYLWAFSGILDGANHTLTVADGGKPLFNYTREATIENLKLYGKQIDGYGLIDRYTVDYGTDGNYNTGCPDTAVIRNVTLLSGMSTKKAGLIGGYASGANDIEIENCTAEAGVIIGYTGQESGIGTFAGGFNGVMRNCTSAATVCGVDKVGGLVGAKGQSMGACTVTNSSFTGTVMASGKWAGGILGSGYEASSAPNTPVASVKNCYVAGKVSGGSNVGGIFGGEPSCKQCWGNGSGAITNNFFYGTVSGSSNVGAIVGYLRGFDKFQGISNNYYLDTCGAASGIGGIGTILTISGNPQDLPYEYDDTYGIDYKFDQTLYCFPKTATEFANGTVTAGLNSGNYTNWEQGTNYPVYGAGAYATALEISGDYKKEYDLGEELDLSGATITVTMSNGTKAHPEWKELTFVGYNPNKVGSQMLQVKYGAVETTITVAVFQPAGKIAVTFSLLGDTVHDSDTDGQVHTLSKGNLQTWIPETQMVVDGRATVKTVLEAALAENGMSCYNPKGNYVVSVTKGDVTLAEFTNGKNTGWMYTLNGHHPENAVNEQYLNNGDVIVFHYTDYYQIEEHEHKWLTSWSYDASSHWKACEWNCGSKKEEAPHTFGAWRTVSSATVDAAEMQARSCAVCGYQEMRSYGSPLEKTCLNDGVSHRYGAWTTATAATVFSPETQASTCELCGKKQYRQAGSALAPTMQVNAEKIILKTGQATTGFRVSNLAAGDSVASYTSSNTKLFTVNGSGKLTAKKKTGSAKLTVTLASGYSRTVTVTVQKAAVRTTKLTGLAKKMTLEKGKKATLSPVVTPFTSRQKVTYTSSNKKVATVSAKGVIVAKKSGTAKITVKSGNKKFVVTVTVPKTPTTAITGVPATVSVKKGKTYTLKAKAAPKGSEEKLTYTSSNKKVATVSKSGKIKGVKKGTATITVKSGKVSVKVTVTVK
ncbi:MAG: Ig-like domain-containing protein [Lachnospiraceae bacterium]|nr:Ig-like domain-containing protein [Lachnospiraceae bacterium]